MPISTLIAEDMQCGWLKNCCCSGRCSSTIPVPDRHSCTAVPLPAHPRCCPPPPRTGFTVAVFRHQPNLRSALLDDLAVSTLPYLYPVGSKVVTRLFLAEGQQGKSIPIQVGGGEGQQGMVGASL